MDDKVQGEKVLEQIEMEVRMRDGACKLLAACSQRDQALEASKNIVSCNCRILALLSQLQRVRRDQVLQRVGLKSDQGLSDNVVPCLGNVAISDLRIPLMWKDSEYFKNKGELHRCAFFCLLQCGSQIFTTDLQIVDRTLTDICFEDNFVFREVGPSFQLRVELYSSCVVEDGSMGTRRGSLGVTAMGNFSGKKIRAAFESAAVCGSYPSGKISPSISDPSTLEPKFSLLAHVTLILKHIQDGFKTHDLTLEATEESSFWLPLYGNICCRLVAQPQCMLTPAFCGQLNIKLQKCHEALENVYGVLKGRSLVCYQSEEEQESGPLLVIPLRKDAHIFVSEPEDDQQHSIHISTKEDRDNVIFTVTATDTHHWTKSFWQHLYNMEEMFLRLKQYFQNILVETPKYRGQWQQCCTELMKLEVSVTRKSKTVKQGSLFHEIVTPSPPREGPVDSDLSANIHSFLASYYKESYE